MAGVKISNLPAAGALTGTELVAVVKGGVTSQTTTAAVAGATGVSTFSAGTTGLTPASATAGAISLAGTLAVANGGTGVTSSTGTGSTVLSASPTFTGTLAAATVNVSGVSTLTSGAIVQGLTVGKGGNSVATNTAMGDSALLGNVGGSTNTAIGWSALSGNTSGGSNTALGYATLIGNLTTSNNTAIGSNALQISTGTSNLAIGAGAGSALTTGSNNTIIGSVAGTAGLEATVIIAAGNNERMRINSTGEMSVPTKVLVGGPTSAIYAGGVQVYGDATTTAPNMLQRGYSNTATGPSHLFVKTRGTTATSSTAVQINDSLGTIGFIGSDGTSNVSLGAITSFVDGYNGATVSTGNVPTAISFTTGVSSGLARMIITSAGNIGMGTLSPSISAALEVSSVTQGVRFPVMTTTQKNAIGSPVSGLVVFDTTLAKLCVYSGSAWQTITSI